jgi:glutamate mutase epsilon subunit
VKYKNSGIAINDSSYEPNREITRAEFIKMVVRALSCRYTFSGTDTEFSDIDKNDWYAEYIKYAVDHNWVSGYPDGTFRANNLISRAEAVKIIVQAIKLPVTSQSSNSFHDVSSDSQFYSYIETLKSNKVIVGKTPTYFHPDDNMTRAEVARIIYKVFLG